VLKQAFSIFVLKLYGFCLSIVYIACQRHPYIKSLYRLTDIYIYREKSTVQLTSVGLAHARPNKQFIKVTLGECSALWGEPELHGALVFHKNAWERG